MKATTKLFNAAYKSLIKPRSQWDTVSSAFATVVSILSSQTHRDKFVDTVNKGIINPSILGQADMGFFMTLALHHDLNNDLFKRNNFDVEEFMQGAEPALENFHEVLYSLDGQVLPEFVKELETVVQTLQGEKKIEGETKSVETLSTTLEKLNYVEGVIKDKVDWKKKAQENPDSLYGQLYAMVSEQVMEACQVQFVTSVMQCYMNQIPRMAYTVGSGEIKNIALLSARAHEVIPESDQQEDDQAGGGEKGGETLKQEPDVMVDVSLTQGIEKKYPVAAQIEVIYSISQRFQRKLVTSSSQPTNSSKESVNAEEKNVSKTMNDDGGDGNHENDNDDNDDEQVLNTAWVAIFEGMLNDGTDNVDSLRWKLIDNRPAWEFPGADMLR